MGCAFRDLKILQVAFTLVGTMVMNDHDASLGTLPVMGPRLLGGPLFPVFSGWPRPYLTFIAAARAHAGLKVLRVRAGDAEVQLRLQHALPHSLALFTGGGAAGRPRRPVGVDAGFRGVICKECLTCSPWEPVGAMDALCIKAYLCVLGTEAEVFSP